MRTIFSDDVDQNIGGIEDEDCFGPLLPDREPEPDTRKVDRLSMFVPGTFDPNNSECNGV